MNFEMKMFYRTCHIIKVILDNSLYLSLLESLVVCMNSGSINNLIKSTQNEIPKLFLNTFKFENKNIIYHSHPFVIYFIYKKIPYKGYFILKVLIKLCHILAFSA